MGTLDGNPLNVQIPFLMESTLKDMREYSLNEIVSNNPPLTYSLFLSDKKVLKLRRCQ